MKRIILISIFILFVAASYAQEGIPFTASTSAVGIQYKGSWSAATTATESLDVIDWGAAKGSSLSVEGTELMAPSANFNAYFGQVKIVPDISALLKKTNISTDQFSVYAQGGVGVATLTPGNKIAFRLCGGANYRMTPNLSWQTVSGCYGRVGSTSYETVSSGLVYLFNPQASKSAAVQRMMARRALKR